MEVQLYHDKMSVELYMKTTEGIQVLKLDTDIQENTSIKWHLEVWDNQNQELTILPKVVEFHQEEKPILLLLMDIFQITMRKLETLELHIDSL